MVQLFLRMMVQQGMAMKQATAILFVDLKSAFYTVVRELVLPLDREGRGLEVVLGSFDSKPAIKEALMKVLLQPAMLSEQACPAHLAAMAAEAHCNTWFVTEGCKDIAVSNTSSMPGRPMADLIFNFLLAPALKEIDEWRGQI